MITREMILEQYPTAYVHENGKIYFMTISEDPEEGDDEEEEVYDDETPTEIIIREDDEPEEASVQ
jgi:hypothetical protein